MCCYPSPSTHSRREMKKMNQNPNKIIYCLVESGDSFIRSSLEESSHFNYCVCFYTPRNNIVKKRLLSSLLSNFLFLSCLFAQETILITFFSHHFSFFCHVFPPTLVCSILLSLLTCLKIENYLFSSAAQLINGCEDSTHTKDSNTLYHIHT